MNYCDRCIHFVHKKKWKNTVIPEHCEMNDPDFGALCGKYDYNEEKFRKQLIDKVKKMPAYQRRVLGIIWEIADVR